MASVTGTFTAVGVSSEIVCPKAGDIKISVTNGVGAVILEHSPDGSRAVWRLAPVTSAVIAAKLAAADASPIVVSVKAGDVFRLHCTTFTSGTFLYNVAIPEDVSLVPLPVGTPEAGGRLAVMGDSISANAGIDTGTAVPPAQGLRTQGNNGYVTWVPMLSRQRLNIEPGANFSLSGRTSADIATQIYNVIRYKPVWCIVEAGTNDPGNVLTPAQSIANLKSIYDALRAAGIRVLAIPPTPRTAPNAYSTAQNQHLGQIGRFIRQYAQTYSGVVIADPRFNGFMNLSSGAPATGVTADGLHPNQAGAYIWGKTVVAALAPFTQSQDNEQIWLDPLDTYDATWNPTGNMLSNSLFITATGGTLTGNSLLTGSVPASWTAVMTKADAAYTGTIAITNVARSDGLSGQLLRITAASLVGTVSGGAQDHVQIFQQINLPAGINPGDVVECMAEVRVNATTGFNGFDANVGISDGNGTTSFATAGGPATNSSAFAQGTYNVVVKSPKTVVGPALGAGQRVIQGFVNVYFDTTAATGPVATAVIDVASLSVRKILPA